LFSRLGADFFFFFFFFSILTPKIEPGAAIEGPHMWRKLAAVENRGETIKKEDLQKNHKKKKKKKRPSPCGGA
jgi:hypothetical protein